MSEDLNALVGTRKFVAAGQEHRLAEVFGIPIEKFMNKRLQYIMEKTGETQMKTIMLSKVIEPVEFSFDLTKPTVSHMAGNPEEGMPDMEVTTGALTYNGNFCWKTKVQYSIGVEMEFTFQVKDDWLESSFTVDNVTSTMLMERVK